jgi:hypothetical protein
MLDLVNRHGLAPLALCTTRSLISCSEENVAGPTTPDAGNTGDSGCVQSRIYFTSMSMDIGLPPLTTDRVMCWAVRNLA